MEPQRALRCEALPRPWRPPARLPSPPPLPPHRLENISPSQIISAARLRDGRCLRSKRVPCARTLGLAATSRVRVRVRSRGRPPTLFRVPKTAKDAVRVLRLYSCSLLVCGLISAELVISQPPRRPLFAAASEKRAAATPYSCV